MVGVIDKVADEKHEGDALCVGVWNNYVFSGGADGKIKIFDNDLNPIRTLDAHDYYIYAMAVNSKNGKVYTSSCDGAVKYMLPPYDSSPQQLVQCEDPIQAMYVDKEILYTGDDKGVVTNWENDKMLFKFNLIEEVKSLAADNELIYTVRDLDVVVSAVISGKSGKYSTKAVIPGKSPLALVGPIVEGHRKFIAFPDRSGKGLMLLKNMPDEKFQMIWKNEDCHEMIINSICGNDETVFSGGYDKKVKAWTDLEGSKPKCLGDVDVGSCVNHICCDANPNTVYIASSDGVVRRATFS